MGSVDETHLTYIRRSLRSAAKDEANHGSIGGVNEPLSGSLGAARKCKAAPERAMLGCASGSMLMTGFPTQLCITRVTELHLLHSSPSEE